MPTKPRKLRSIRRAFHVLIMVVSLALASGLAAAVPAQAASDLPSGDFTLTMSASDLGIDPVYLQDAVNEVNTEDAREGITISQQMERDVAEFGGDTSNWVDVPEATASMSSDGTSVILTVPAAEVQTTGNWIQGMISWAAGFLAGYGLRGVCISALTASGVGAALIPLICTPLGGAVGGAIKALVDAAFDGDLGSTSFWTNLIISTVGGAVGGFVWEKWMSPFFKGGGATGLKNIGTWLVNKAQSTVATWFGSTTAGYIEAAGNEIFELAGDLPAAAAAYDGDIPAAGPLPCDVYNGDGEPCGAAYSTVRALFSYYGGPLYQVQRASDNATADIGLLAVGGYVNAAAQDSFCASTSCVITKIYDQSPQENDLTVEQAGGAAGADGPASATALPVTVDGHEAYGVDFTGAVGYRDNATTGIATDGAAEGMYMVASGTNVNSGCCFDFGNAETNTRDNGAGHMDAVNVTTWCGSNVAPCAGTGPWVEADMENGQWTGNGSNPANTGVSGDFVTAMLKNNGQDTFALQGGNSQSGGLTKYWDGSLPSGYAPMQQEGAVVLGTGGDNSDSGIGSFFEGVMTYGFPSDAADASVQANIVSAGYTGSSGGTGGEVNGVMPSAAGPAVVHSAGATGAASSGFSSVYTVNSANGHLQETYLPYIGDSWTTQDLSAKYGTPTVMPGTQPVALVHCGYTSVYTVDASSGDLQETYLPAIGDSWSTQDLSANYGTPPTDETPTAVMHMAGASGATQSCGFASVYTVDRNGDLQETYLPNAGFPGDAWVTQDLSGNYGTPGVQPGTSPVAIVHCGYTSVYTVDGGSHDLQETYLPAIGGSWNSQDLSANYGTPKTDTTPTAVVHTAGAAGATGGCGYTSVYTVDQGSRHLDETYLPNSGFPGDAWVTQDLSAKYGTPAVAPGTAPAALVHMNYTSVYTIDQGSDQLQETYLPAIGDSWASQSLSANYGTPATDQTPIVLLHPDANGNLDWASVYTINEFNNDLQETYLSNTGFPGDAWVTQDLSGKYGTPTVAIQQSSESSWTVDHSGYASAYTVDKSNNDLQETYLPAIGDSWTTQDLSNNYGTPAVADMSAPSALVHDGYTSVYTVDSDNDDLQETYLPAIGDSWSTQNLFSAAGTPEVAANTSPASLFHDGYTSVYTVDANGDLQETYLPGAGFPGDAWHSQDLSANYGTPKVKAGTSPVAIFHDGYDSVYTVDASGDLQETYLPVMGGNWVTQDLTSKYGTPQTATTPTAVFHDGYTSVYTVDTSGDLQETYLPAIADNWVTQDLTSKYGAPAAQQGTILGPVALYHTGYTSVYYLNSSNSDVEEAYLPAIGDAWQSQDLSANYGTPSAAESPSPLVHYAANGGKTWTSLYTVDNSNDDLQETYLPAIGDNWVTQDLSAKYGTPAV